MNMDLAGKTVTIAAHHDDGRIVMIVPEEGGRHSELVARLISIEEWGRLLDAAAAKSSLAAKAL